MPFLALTPSPSPLFRTEPIAPTRRKSSVMKAVYLLPCTCGQKVRVDAGQAGAKVPCACGQQLTVPTFRALRELEQEVPVAAVPVRGAATNDWDAVRGLLFSVGLLAFLVSA